MSLYTKNLIVNVDINNPRCIDDDYNLISLHKWKNAKSSSKITYDYGLTSFDVGHTNKMESPLTLNSKDLYFTLKRVGENQINNPTKNEFRRYSSTVIYDDYEIERLNDCLNLKGGYFNGFFKLDGYDYEVLPNRFKNGFTIENLLCINEDTEGLFFTVGCRAEDKYNLPYKGEGGVTTSDGLLLDSLRDSWEYNKAFRLYEEELRKDIKLQPDNIDNISNNLLGFGITKNKEIYYQYITNEGFLKLNTSPHTFLERGSVLISIAFIPDYEIDDKDLKCHKQRNGILYVYINSFLFWTVKDFPEPIFREINNDSSKQIGIPYTISWGGGSFGLKNSYHYESLERFLYENQDVDYINNNFSCKNDEINLNDSTGFTLDHIFFYRDSIRVVYDKDLIEENSLLLLFDNDITVLNNRNYEVSLLFHNNNFLKKSNNNLFKLHILNDGAIEILSEEKKYVDDNNWVFIKTKFKLKNNVIEDNIKLGFIIKSDLEFNVGESFYISNFSYSGSDILVKDPKKNGLFIQENFNNSFKGGLKKLRVYEEPLTQSQILRNVKNEELGNTIKRGGRLIFMGMEI